MFTFRSTNGWVGVVKVSAIAKSACLATVFLSVFYAFALKLDCTLAQSNIIPDTTLGAENSTVTSNFNGLPIEVIDGVQEN